MLINIVKKMGLFKNENSNYKKGDKLADDPSNISHQDAIGPIF